MSIFPYTIGLETRKCKKAETSCTSSSELPKAKKQEVCYGHLLQVPVHMPPVWAGRVEASRVTTRTDAGANEW